MFPAQYTTAMQQDCAHTSQWARLCSSIKESCCRLVPLLGALHFRLCLLDDDQQAASHLACACCPGWRTRHPESLCFSASGELLLYGPMLWDPRSPRCVHTFDVLTYNPCASTFHPAGLEAIVNAEVSNTVNTSRASYASRKTEFT